MNYFLSIILAPPSAAGTDVDKCCQEVKSLEQSLHEPRDIEVLQLATCGISGFMRVECICEETGGEECVR